MSKVLFCFGYGYTSDYLGHALISQKNWRISGTTRDEQKSELYAESGINLEIFDYQTPLFSAASILRDTTHILISTPPGTEGDPTYLMHAQDIAQMPHLEWIGYLSSTGVYGDRQGGWVNEADEPNPTSQRGSRRFLAEQQWQRLADNYNLPLHIFRLSGIYGPGRSALDSVRAGSARRIEKPGHAFNRIHIDDIIQVIMNSMHAPTPGEIFNLSDDEAAPSHEVIEYACKLLNMTPPPLIAYEDADLAPITRSFYEDNKRIENKKIKDMLGVTLHHPNHRAGLEACLASEQANALPDVLSNGST